MRYEIVLAAVISPVFVLPVAAQAAGQSANGTGTGAAGASGLSTGSTESAGAPPGGGAGFAAGGVEVLCLPAGASVTEPFFLGTDLSCAR